MHQFSLLLGMISAFVCFFLFSILLRQRPFRQERVLFALSLFILGFWVIANFLHHFTPSPPVGLSTFQYRAVFSLESLVLAFLLLFGLSHFKGKPLKGRSIAIVVALFSALAAINATGLVIKRGYLAGWTALGSKFAQEEGPLYPLSVSIMGGSGILFVGLLLAKWRRSRGIERYRTSYMLWGFGLYIPAFIVLSGIVPAITGTDVASDYLFALSVIPYALTTYSLTRYRLLDVRIAARRTISHLLAALLFAIPPFFAFATLGDRLMGRTNAAAYLFVGYMGFSMTLVPTTHRFLERVVSRLIFPGLFDVERLVARAARTVIASEDPGQGLEEALLEVTRTLRLEQLIVRIHPDGDTLLEVGWRKWHDGWENLEKWKRLMGALPERKIQAGTDEAAEVTRERPEEEGVRLFRAPLRGLTGICGELVAEKAGGMEPLDLDFLELLSREFGMVVENHLHHLRLLAQLKQLERTQEALARSSRLSEDIVMVTSHELKTPLTILYGLSSVLGCRGTSASPGLEAIRSEAERLRDLADALHMAALGAKGTEPAIQG
ncbi:MAG: hypothetical protein WHT46_06635 [Candidatus Geothermincolales bacterium]